MMRDEVMAMTDEELQIKAAELRGWVKTKSAITMSSPSGHQGVDTGKVWWRHPGTGMQASNPPDYLNDIAAANDLIPLMIAQGYKVIVEHWYMGATYVVQCTVERSDVDWVVDEQSFDGFDGLAPLAITRAFILAILLSEEPSDD